NLRALRALRSPLEKIELDPALLQLRLLEVANAVSTGDLALPDPLVSDVLTLTGTTDPRSSVGAVATRSRDIAADGAARWSTWGNDARRSPAEARLARVVKEAFEVMWHEFEGAGR
ncbi:MAG: hypothetical protein Q7V62_15405, partial [Actinomycetota bacterium]|nr:hypothetical protein [Actinomycetota bacterium]